jgi:hypothetical protein
MNLWKTWMKLWIRSMPAGDNFLFSVDKPPISVENPVETAFGVTLHV